MNDNLKEINLKVNKKYVCVSRYQSSSIGFGNKFLLISDWNYDIFGTYVQWGIVHYSKEFIDNKLLNVINSKDFVFIGDSLKTEDIVKELEKLYSTHIKHSYLLDINEKGELVDIIEGSVVVEYLIKRGHIQMIKNNEYDLIPNEILSQSPIRDKIKISKFESFTKLKNIYINDMSPFDAEMLENCQDF